MSGDALIECCGYANVKRIRWCTENVQEVHSRGLACPALRLAMLAQDHSTRASIPINYCYIRQIGCAKRSHERGVSRVEWSLRQRRHLELDLGELVGGFADFAQEGQPARVGVDF